MSRRSTGLIGLLGASMIAAQINTPTPFQIGIPTNCAGFTMASSGMDCSKLAANNGLTLEHFLDINPQVHGEQGCATSIWPGYWYCVNTETPVTFYRAPTAPPPPPPPAATTLVTVNIPPPAPATTAAAAGAKATPPATCAGDTNCYHAFQEAPQRVHASQSSWCSKVLAATTTAQDMAAFTGAPALVARQCSGDAHVWLSSLCSCWNDGTMPTGVA